ncbi:hypothetical protein VTO73DRAFT_1635 [Trametes versicolor]
MPKRSLSPAPLPPPKRIHTATEDHPHAVFESRPFDTILSDEIVLFVFHYLSSSDLCAVQRTNKNWARLSLDNQLWKSLYINEYGRTRLRGGRGFIGRGDGREIKPLPGRSAIPEEVKDWKWMFRISSNWRTGRCSLEHYELGTSARLFAHAQAPDQTHLLLAGNLTIMASSEANRVPAILLSSPAHEPHTLHCPSSRPATTTRITALALDQAPPTTGHHGRLICFLATGEFSLYSINHQTPSSSSRVLTYQPSRQSSRTTPIVQAVYHHPLLVTLSQSFNLSLYDLSSNSVQHTQTLTSFTSFPPSSLVLSCQSPSAYRLILAYATPVYPVHWSVGATELLISGSDDSRMTVTNTRTTRTMDVPQGWVDESRMRAVREQWGRKVARVADTQTDGKWVILAPGQLLSTIPGPSTPSAGGSSSTTPPPSPAASSTYTSSSLHTASGLQLYRLYLPSSSSSSSSPKLTYVRTLHGQIGPVSTLALADGRCVSLGMNGSLWVWDLEAGTGTEVSPGITGPQDAEGDGEENDPLETVKVRVAIGARGSVVFDDRRIVSSHDADVEIRRFDI